jgi:hypothetical protein
LQRIIGNQGMQQLFEASPDSPAASSSYTATARSRQDFSQAPAQAETGAAEDLDVLEPHDDVAVAQGPGAPDAGVPAAPSASLSVTGDGSYVDTATESRKNVKFEATWSGGSKEDYIIVNWLKGYMKKPDGTPFKVSMYGSLVDFNFAAWQVDSVDEDPAYWSSGGTRWRYNVDAVNKFSATDSPRPPSFAMGTMARVDFKTAVYKSSDVPLKTSGSLAATPLSSFSPWTYYVQVVPANYVELNPPLTFDHT